MSQKTSATKMEPVDDGIAKRDLEWEAADPWFRQWSTPDGWRRAQERMKLGV